MFSKCSFATTSSMFFKQQSRIKSFTPKVNISKIIKKKANLYWDKKLVNNFDDLLEKGYNIVLNKKHQRDVLKEEEDYL